MGGGKNTSSTQSVTIPPDVLARYNSVNATAQSAASTPFQMYGGNGVAATAGSTPQASSFVAPVNATQQAGIQQIQDTATEAQPYFANATTALGSAQSGVNPVNAAATGLAAAGAGPVNAQQIGADQINQFENPYLQTVLGNTASLINQENQQAAGGESGNAIKSGAFGGDREGIAQANLQQQQILGEGNVFSGIASNAFNTALGAAQQQQGVNLQAGQANRAALETAGTNLANIGQTAYGEGANTASELANLGTGAQSAAQTGAENVLGAGTVQQQTTQAGDTALYNQFLQQQSYPFQTAQFLANVAEGTGALSGSTTTTTQPGGFFSDRRLKTDVEPIGKLFDGQTIVRFKYKGEPHTRIGLIAQDVEKRHPEAVGTHASGFKTVEHGAATEDAAARGHFRAGGVVPSSAGGIVDLSPFREAYAGGGITPVVLPGLGAADINAILQLQQKMYGSTPGARGVGNKTAGLSVPSGGAAPALAVASPINATPPRTGAQNTNDSMKLIQNGKSAYSALKPKPVQPTPSTPSGEAPATWDPAAPTVGAPDVSGDVAPTLPDAGLAPSAGAAPAAQVASDATTADSALGGLGAAGADAAATDAGAAALADAGAAAGTAAVADMAPEALAVLAAARGGHVRAGLAAGGMPYSDPGADALVIPDENSANKLLTAQSAPTPKQSTLQQIGEMPNNMMNMLQNPGSTIPNLATGGLVPRIAKADGGDFSENPDENGFFGNLWASMHADPNQRRPGSDINGYEPPTSPLTPTPTASAPAAGLGAASAAPDPELLEMLGHAPPAAPAQRPRAPTPAPVVAPTASAAVAAASPPTPGLAPATVDAGQPDYGPPAPTGAATPSAAPAALAGAEKPGAAPATPAAASAPSTGSGLKDKLGAVWDNLKSADSSTLQGAIPLLTGLAAMGTAPTRHLGVALAAGLGAGGQSYMDTKKQLADVAQTQATTRLTDTQRARQAVLTAQGAFDPVTGMVHLADGSNMPYAKYITMATPPATLGSPQALGALNAPGMDYAKVGKSHGYGAPGGAVAAPTGYAVPSPKAVSAIAADASQNMLPSQLAGAEKRTHDTEDAQTGLPAAAAAARQQGTQLTNLARTISESPDAGLSSGALQPMKMRAVQIWDDLMTTAGHGKGAANDLTIGDGALDNALVQRKLAAGLSFAQASSSGQHSLEALQASTHTNPDGTIPRAAAAEMTANLMIEKQRAIDEDNYERAARHSVQHPGYDASAARAQFRSEFSDERYQKEKESLTHLILQRPSGLPQGSVISQMLNGNTRYNPDDIEAAYNTPGLSRYFYNR